METVFMNFYFGISLVFAAFDLFFALMCFRRKETEARYLGFTAIAASVVDLTYLLSILTENRLTASVMSSAYFISIDWTLVGIIVFLSKYLSQRPLKRTDAAKKCMILFAVFETVVFAVNPVFEIAVSYADSGARFAGFTFIMKPLYILHLVYTYAMVAYVLFILVRRAAQVPEQYGRHYRYIIAGILGVVAVNALFLFVPKGQLPKIDYSICGYSLILMLIYWSCFRYTSNDMIKDLSVTVFENIGQGIVLFDFEELLVMKNERAEQLLSGVKFTDRMPMSEFLSQCGIPARVAKGGQAYSIQCYMKGAEGEQALRCDYRPMEDNGGQRVGGLYVFTDAALDTDLLTGFHKWESYRKFAAEKRTNRKKAVAVFDINSLGEINSTQGIDEGDRQIRLLAASMRKCLPAESYYIRGQDALLGVVCYEFDEAVMRQFARRVVEDYDGDALYAVCAANAETGDSIPAIDEAIESLRIKKLLDTKSNHSQALTSLVRALEECDSDTEAHVRRTQKMGAMLSERIGLSDSDRSKLRLLCLLHDIGKIGIPLEILNKPGKLNPEEWVTIRSHVEKGYQIAMSSDQLSCIAEMVRHHHERWDGNGYPSGLKREQIPLLSRIIAVVDAYDAMVSDRPYHKGCSVEEALQELERCAGSQFDPYIAEEFVQLIRETRGDIRQLPQGSAPVRKIIDSKKAEDDAAAANVYPVRFSRYLVDADERIVEMDEMFTEITGYTPEDVRERGMTQLDLIPPGERTEYLALVTVKLTKSSNVYLEHKLKKKDGSETFVLCYAEVIYDPVRKARRTKIVISEISTSYAARMLSVAESSKSQKRLRYWDEIYRRDSMTGLLNHIAFQSDVEEKLLKERKKILLMMLDVDHFKSYNLRNGHESGDALIVALAKALKSTMTESEYACRMGGDELAVAIPWDMEAPEEDLRQRARALYLSACEAAKSMPEEAGVSAGIAISDPLTEDFKELYRQADQALYTAKQGGRGRMIIAGRYQEII